MFSLLRTATVVAATLSLLALPGTPSAASGAAATAHVSGSARTPVSPKAAKTRTTKPKPRPAAADTGLPNDPLWRDSWSLTKVRAPAAWRVTRGAAEVVVAVLDTGIDRNHPDLQGSFVDGWDAVNEDADATDDHGHGTLVAGVIAARANNGIGGVGACSQCSLMPVKVIGADGSGTAADIAEGIVWAADHGARVINMSFVMSGHDGGVAAALEHARSKGVLIVAAAGNDGGAEATFPAAQPGIVSVTGTDPSDARYEWATYGRWVTVAAPGCSLSTQAGGGYADFCGTSSAAAFASGIAALARSSAPDRTSAEVGERLSSSAVPVGEFVASGRVDAEAVVASLRTAGSQTPGSDVAPPVVPRGSVASE